jgi:hypothetical protein
MAASTADVGAMSSVPVTARIYPSPLAARSSVHDRPGKPRGALGIMLILFLLSCVFDPADKVLSLKVWLFSLCWVFTLLFLVSSRAQRGVPRELLIYTLLFILVPLFSIVWYWLSNGSDRFEGFSMLKGYVLITLAAMLVLNRINLLPLLCAVLTVLALAVVGVFIAIQLVPGLYAALYLFGPSTGILFVDNRDYGSGVRLLQVYFVTSPMLAISVAYYFDRARSARRAGATMLFWGLVVINILGMLLAGSRNNILVAFLLPIVLSFVYARNKAIGALFGLFVIAILAVVFANRLGAFFDPTEVSNSAKLSLLEGYGRIFSDPLSLILGRGLGAYEQFTRGNLYVTEFTYFEVLRNFGLLGAMVILGLLLFPVAHAFAANRARGDKAIAVGFAFYLLMCVTNPNLFSSMGILILSVIIANIFLPDRAVGRR